MFCGGNCGIFSNCGGICCLASGSGSDVNSDYGDLLFPTTTTTNIPTTTTALHTLRYGTFGDGWVLMSVVVMVGFCW